MLVMLNIFAVVAAIIIIGVVIFAVSLVNASKKSVSQEDSLEGKIREAISTARRIKFKSQADIEKLKMWANDAISVTFGDIITEFTTDEYLDNFEQIKNKYADKVDPGKLEKTEKIVQGYKGQIAIKQVELETAQRTEQKYSKLLEQLKSSKLENKALKRLTRHEQRLEIMQNDVSAQKQLIEKNLSYDLIKDDLEQQLESLKALNQLQEQFDTKSFVQNAEVYKQEMDKIVNKLD